jgi:hypothetical protein
MLRLYAQPDGYSRSEIIIYLTRNEGVLIRVKKLILRAQTSGILFSNRGDFLLRLDEDSVLDPPFHPFRTTWHSLPPLPYSVDASSLPTDRFFHLARTGFPRQHRGDREGFDQGQKAMNHGQHPLERLRVGIPFKLSTPKGCIGEGIEHALDRLEHILEMTGAPLRYEEAPNMVEPTLIGGRFDKLS